VNRKENRIRIRNVKEYKCMNNVWRMMGREVLDNIHACEKTEGSREILVCGIHYPYHGELEKLFKVNTFSNTEVIALAVPMHNTLLDLLSTEIVSHICSFLDFKALCTASQVCHALYVFNSKTT
jgi:hypothetical protein